MTSKIDGVAGHIEITGKEEDRYPGAEEIENLWKKMNAIEEKNKCIRVQFLDWFSDKLLDWSNRTHVMSVRIDSPCVLKVEPRKKTESKSAIENREIDRLQELLARERERNSKKGTE